MRFKAFGIAFCGLLLVACGGQPEAQLVGTWKADADAMAQAMLADPKLAKLPPKAQEAALAQGKIMLQTLSAQFTPDGQLILMLGRDLQESGTYSVKSVQGTKFTISSTVKGQTQTMVATVDGGRLLMKMGDTQMIFTK